MTYPAEVLADSPLAYWRLGETSGTTMVDSSGNGRDGTYAGTVTLGAASLLADGTDSCVDFTPSTGQASVPSASWQSPAALTVEFLAEFDSVSTSSQYLVCRDDANVARSWNVSYENGTVYFYVWIGGSFHRVLTSVPTVVVGTTYHIAASFDGSTQKLYVDGVERASQSTSGALDNPTQPLTLARSGFPHASFNGRLDEVAVYGSALSGARIAAHYAAATSVGDPGGSFALTLPRPTVAFSGTAPTPGTLAIALPAPTVALTGSAPHSGALGITLPLPSMAAVGTTPPARTGFGLVLDSTATVTAEPPLEAFPPGPGGVPDPVQHIITPTVPAPVLTNGRPS